MKKIAIIIAALMLSAPAFADESCPLRAKVGLQTPTASASGRTALPATEGTK